MKQFKQSLTAASVLLALSLAPAAWANPTNTVESGKVGSQDASVDATGKGLGNAAASENSTSTVGDITKYSNNPDSSVGYDGKAKAEDQGAAVNGSGTASTANTKTITDTTTKTRTDTSTVAKDDGIASSGSGAINSNSNNTKTINDTFTKTRTDTSATAKDKGIASSGSGEITSDSNNTKTITETTTKTRTDTSTVAKEDSIASSGSGEVTSASYNTKTRTDVSAKDDGVAANGGDATSTVTTHKAEAGGDGAASSNEGNATAQYVETKLHGNGNAVAGIGNATTTYKVNNQYLDGTVTGHPSDYPVDNWVAVPVGNTISNSVIGNAGITQTFQNSGNGLAQQSVLVDGTVTVTQGTATLTTP